MVYYNLLLCNYAGVYKFSERLEESLSTVDDFIIRHVQLAMNPLTVAFATFCSGKL